MKGFRFIRRMAETEPFKSGIVREVDPGVDQTSDEQLRGELPISSCYRVSFNVICRRLHQKNCKYGSPPNRESQYATP